MYEIREKKYAVILDGRRITEYMYDDVMQTTNTLYGIKNVMKDFYVIHAYSKKDGSVLFKKEIKKFSICDEYVIMEVSNELFYVYFDSILKIKGPFYEVESERYLITVKKLVNDKALYGAYNAEGNLVLPVKYNYICAISDEFLEVGYKKGKTGLVDYDGDYILYPTCEEVFYYFDDTLITYYNVTAGAYGAIDAYGREVVPCKYDEIEVDEERNLIYVLEHGLYGIYKYGQGCMFSPMFRSLSKNIEVVELMGIDHTVYGYIPKVDLLIPRNYYVYYPKYLKYFNGRKWCKLKYDKE